MKIRVLALAALGVIALSVSAASARSCSEQGQLCVNWANGNISDPDRKRSAQSICRSEVPKCIARCKKGEKHFVGIGGTTTYPIDTCN